MAPIFVKTSTGETIAIDVDGSETIDTMRAKIQQITSIPVERLRVVFEEEKSAEGHDGEEGHLGVEGLDGCASGRAL